jgi:hypothetical protein
MTELTKKGAVADTWAPNGQSSLMLAAAANSAKAITLLLSAGASLELQDAMGRTALMWAAGSDSLDALKVLLDAGASLALRDRRNRSACDYAEKPEAKKVLEAKVKELESKATAAQEALLAELVEEEERKAASKASKKAKKKEKKKGGKGSGKETSGGNSGGSGGVKDGAGKTSSGTIDNESVEETKILVEVEAEEEQIEGRTETEMPSIEATTATTATAGAPLPTPSTATVEVHPDTTTTKTPVVVSAPLNIAAATAVRPPSPEWCTVGSAKKEKQLPPPPGTTNAAAKSAFHAHHHHQYQHRRSPSVGSVTSISSGTSSHETDGSSIGGKHSGSERSVLRRVAAVGASSLGTSVPRLPAPLQRQAVCTRSTSGGEEVGAAALFGTSNDGSGSGSGGSTFKPGSWASIAASQKSSGTKASNSGAPGAPAFTTAPQEYHQQQPHENPATLDTSSLSLPGSAAAAWATISGTNTLTTPSGGSSIDGSSHSNYNNNSSITVATAPITISPASAVALQRAAAEEIAALRSEIQRLKLKNAAAELAHHQELVAILQDASQHENAAVLKATSDERLACSIRFAALLQNNGVALAGAIPGLLAGAGITSASDLDIFMNASNGGGINNSNNGINGGASSSARAITSENLNNNNLNLCSGGGGGGAAADVSPLSTSPFSYEVGEHLRGDFFGNHSAFMVPAIETHTSSMSGCSPPEGGHVAGGGGAESFMSKAVSTSAWSPLGNGTSSVWGSAIR